MRYNRILQELKLLKLQTMMQAAEAYGHIDSNGSLQIQTPLPLKEGDVKVIIMYAGNEEMTEEQLWIRISIEQPAFLFPANPNNLLKSLVQTILSLFFQFV